MKFMAYILPNIPENKRIMMNIVTEYSLMLIAAYLICLLIKYNAWQDQLALRTNKVIEVAQRVHALPIRGSETIDTSYNFDLIVNDNDIAKDDRITYYNVFHGKTYMYGEFFYYRYNTVSGKDRIRYKDKCVDCSVIDITLPQKMPDIIIDSTYFDGQQFHLYSGNILNRGSTTGTFINLDDKTLAASPVRKVIKKLPDCDIEIQDKKLYVYTSFLPTATIPKFVRVSQQLANTFTHYMKSFQVGAVK